MLALTSQKVGSKTDVFLRPEIHVTNPTNECQKCDDSEWVSKFWPSPGADADFLESFLIGMEENGFETVVIGDDGESGGMTVMRLPLAPLSPELKEKAMTAFIFRACSSE